MIKPENAEVMEMENTKNLRTLYLAKILYERTDEEHMLTTKDLLEILQREFQIYAHRVTIYEDIEQLRLFGMDIVTTRSSQNRYYLASRMFDLPELKLLIDAVESSKFITAKKSSALVEKLVRFTSSGHAEDLRRDLYPEGRIKQENEKIYYIIDSIHAAINAGKKIAFRYFRYNARKERELRQDGQEYVFSPWMLVWNGDRYYMLGWSDKHQAVSSFRVDRIAEQPRMLEEDATAIPDGFDVSEHLSILYHMYKGERMRVELLCDNDTMGSIIDRFGEEVDTEIRDEDRFIVRVELDVDHLFYSWIFGFMGKVKILSPMSVAEQYRELLRKELDRSKEEG